MNDLYRVPVETIKNIGAGLSFLRHLKEKFSAKRIELVTNPDRPFTIFEQMATRSGGSLDIEGKFILEIGPGNSLAIALLFLAHGARKVSLIDRFQHLFWDSRDIDFHKHILKKIAKSKAPCASSAINSISFDNNANSVNFDNDRIEYQQCDATRLPFASKSIDLVFSNAVLEHIHNPQKVICEIARVTKRNGIGIHEVDFRDHFFKQEPLRLLKYPDWLWNLMSWNRPGYTNRLRAPDFLELFKSAGFDIQRQLTIREYEGNINNLKLDSRFKMYPPDDLRILAFWLMVKKR